MHLKGLHAGNESEFPIGSTLTHKTNANIHTKNKIAFLQDKNQRVKSNSFFLNFST